MYYWLGRTFFRILFRILGGLRSIGEENIPKTGGVIVAPNHVSHADPPAVGCGTSRQVHFMTKDELFRVPVLGTLILKVGSFPVRRGTADRKALRRAIELLNEGRVVCIFSEGTRSSNGMLQEPEPGIGLIALKSRSPVVPAAIIGTDKLLPLHAKFPGFHPTKVIYGKPLSFPDLYDTGHGRENVEEVGRRTMSAIADLLAANG